MSKLIVITDDVLRRDEVACWMEVLEAGVERLHVRKPKASREELEGLLNEVPLDWRKKLVIHYQAELAEQFELGGLHVSYPDYMDKFNRKGAKTLRTLNMPVSCSVHNWEEAKDIIDRCAYCFISPVFDSISKSGYPANGELKQVPAELRGEKIYALGGIDMNNAGEAINNGYYGVVALGYIWQGDEKRDKKVKEILKSINKEKALV
jgi:thiamine-phosphate pyrophosphorylase